MTTNENRKYKYEKNYIFNLIDKNKTDKQKGHK